MIAVVDYGMGNSGSIINMLKKIGYTDALITNDSEVLQRADKIILPGVGSYDQGVNNLADNGLTEVLKECVLKDKKPILGICLGMQLLGNSSKEGTLKGLGFIDFDCERIDSKEGKLRVPHMGWNYVSVCKESKLLKNVVSEQRFYFVHSFHAVCHDESDRLLTCEYGETITAAVQKDNIYGTQFHPEKSHKYGMQIMKNFVENC